MSPLFLERYGALEWPEYFTPDDSIGAMVPVGKRRMAERRSLRLTDRNGGRHECIAETFTQTHQVFVLLHALETRRPTIVPVKR